MAKTAVAIRHIEFENLGAFAPVLAEQGYEVGYCEAVSGGLRWLDPIGPDLLIVLGGPMGVYETDLYPFLGEELRILAARLRADLPTFGVCLGAQLIAAAMGARVFASGVKEIGFSPLSLTAAGCDGPLHHLANVAVLHWHGDTFDIPQDAVHLAATEICAHQAFARGSNILGLQFHVEVDAAHLEPWLVAYAGELDTAGIEPSLLRSAAARAGAALGKSAKAMFSGWLRDLRRRERGALQR